MVVVENTDLFFFFECFAATQLPLHFCLISKFFVLFCYAAMHLALQLYQERAQVVCSNGVARKRPARRHSRNGP